MTEDSGARVSSDVPNDASQTRQRYRPSHSTKTLIHLTNLNFISFNYDLVIFSLDFLLMFQNLIHYVFV